MQHAGTTPKSVHQRWQFSVEIAGFDVAFFMSSSGVDVDNNVSRFNPAGSLASQKTAGRQNWNAVTLQKGKNQEGTDNATAEWLQAVAQAAEGVGGLPSDYLRDADIVEYDRGGTEIRRYRLYNAFPSKVRFGEYTGESDDPTVEELILEYQYAAQVL